MTCDDVLIRLLQAKFEQDKKLDLIEEAGVNLQALRIDLLTIVLDALGVPPEDGPGDEYDRDWIWQLYVEIVEQGSCEEIQEFLARVRGGLQEHG